MHICLPGYPNPPKAIMPWRILSLVIAHVLISEAASTQDAPTQTHRASSSLSSTTVASTGKSNDLPGKSVVVNWKLTCQQLCGEGYGGPTCGFTCLQHWRATDKASRINLDSKALAAVCPTLCANGLGASRCNCKPATPPTIVHDQNGVCGAFCAAANIQLDGCSGCNGEHLAAADDAPDIQTTTPNWDDLCTLWCRIGEGGTLCNCDLPPFV